MFGGTGPDHRVRGHRREGLQDGSAPVHRARHDSHRRVLLCRPHYAVLLSADVLLQASPAQGRRYFRQNGRVLQVHAVPEPYDCRQRSRCRTAHRSRRRDRTDDGFETGAKTRVHGRRPAIANRL